MRKGDKTMNYSKIENSKVYYRLEHGENWTEIDQIDKEDLLVLLDKFISEEDYQKLVTYNSKIAYNQTPQYKSFKK